MKKNNTYKIINPLYEDRELVHNAFKRGIFLLKSTQRMRIKMLTLKQMLQRLPIALAQVKSCNILEKSLNEITKIV